MKTVPDSINKRFVSFLFLLCLLLVFSVSALAATGNVYGLTSTRIRVRESASASGTVFDNIEQGRLVYITESKDSGGTTFLHVKYRTLEGKNGSGWIAQGSGGSTYVEILTDERARSEYGASGGNLPATPAGTKSASEREALRAQTTAQVSSAPAASNPLSGVSDSVIRDTQEKLKAIGFYSGDITGNAGEKTLQAIKAFQKKIGLEETGELTKTTLARLDEYYTAHRQGQTGKTESETTPSAGSGVSARTVEQVQTKLKALGFYSGDITGNIGTKTTNAIIAFQQRYGLSPDGVIGNATLTRLNEVYAQVSDNSTSSNSVTESASVSSDTIRQVQDKLKTLGLYSGEVTGNAGSKTTAAIKAFQEKYGLTADGIPGNATLKKLDEVIAGTSRKETAETEPAASVSSGTIRQVQERLKALGLYSGEVTGNAGSKTTAAIRAFQQKYGLTADGIPGNATLKKLEEVYSSLSIKETAKPAESSSLSADTTRQLQEKLKALGFYSGEITGKIGSKTTAAVKAFQQKYGLTSDGIPGNATLKKLDEVYKNRSSSSSSSSSTGNASVSASAVKNAQTKLKELGFYSGEVTGSIGSKTTAAIRAFQKKYGLTADGVLGSATIAKLNSVYKAKTATSSGSSKSSGSRQIYNLDWFKAKENKLLGHLGLTKGHTVRLTDLSSGKSLNVVIQSAGSHLDVEPATKADTETFLSIYHVSSTSKITFIRRSALVTTEYGYRIVCSFYGQPHGSQLIHSNGFNGQFCIHFLNSKTHGSNVVDGDHQACIRKAVAHYGSGNVKVIRTEDDL